MMWLSRGQLFEENSTILSLQTISFNIRNQNPVNILLQIFSENLCLQSHNYGRNSHHRNPHCNPPCEVLHSKCVRDFFGGTRKNSFSCRCLPGFAPTYLPANPLIPSSKHRLVFCQPTMTNGTLQGSASVSGGAGINGFITHNATVPFKYYPGRYFSIADMVPK